MGACGKVGVGVGQGQRLADLVGLRHRVIPEPAAKRLAPQEAPQRQPRALKHAEPLSGFIRILGTGWLEPAASRKQHRQIGLVKAQGKQSRAHSNTSRGRSRILGGTGRSLGLGRRALYGFDRSVSKSAVSVANGALATLPFGCMTMSHPTGISKRWQRTISRIRRRMRLRTTAPPRAFLMLKPKRLCGSWFTRKNTVKWELERRFPVLYTASNSPRRTNRAARGKSRRPGLLGREAMASLLAAGRQHLAATLRLHARAKSVRFGAPASARLIGSLRQSDPPPCPLQGLPNSTFGAVVQFQAVARWHRRPLSEVSTTR
jgi:hypothetical protein